MRPIFASSSLSKVGLAVKSVDSGAGYLQDALALAWSLPYGYQPLSL